MQWWTHLWLNEGFASHVEYVVQDKLFPSWNMWAIFASTTQSAAFSLDAMASTHPVEIECKTEDEINEIFDIISYRKGSSIIRMLFSHLGYDTAFKGLASYLHKFALKNAETEDLWEALGTASGKPVAQIMRKWTSTSGYPYIAVSRAPGGGLALASRRFISAWARDAAAWPAADDFASGASVGSAAAAAARYPPAADAKPCDVNEDWNVPLSVVVPSAAGGVEARALGIVMLDEAAAPAAAASREAKLAAAAAELHKATAGAAFFKLNAQHASFFRTVYDAALLKQLLPAVATPADRARAPLLEASDRIGLVGDVAAAVGVGMASPGDLMALCHAARFDGEYTVWSAMLGGLGELKEAADALGEAGAFFTPWLRALLQPVVALVGFDAKAGEHSNVALLRALVLRYAAVCGMQTVVAECLARFDAYEVRGAPLAADLKQLVCVAPRGRREARARAAAALSRARSRAHLPRRLTARCSLPPHDLSRACRQLLDRRVARRPGALRGAVAPPRRGHHERGAAPPHDCAGPRHGPGAAAAHAEPRAERQDQNAGRHDSDRRRRLQHGRRRARPRVALRQGELGRALWKGECACAPHRKEERARAHRAFPPFVAAPPPPPTPHPPFPLSLSPHTLSAQLGSTFGIWAHVLGAATANFSSKAKADEIAAFFTSHPTGPAARTIKQSLEAIRARAWRVHLLKADIDAVSKLNFAD